MSRRNRLVAATAAALMMVGSLLGISLPRAAAEGGKATHVGGGWIEPVPPIPTNPASTSVDDESVYAEADGSTIWDGDLVGVTHVSGKATFDRATNDTEMEWTETFRGMAVADGSVGTLELIGIGTIDGTTGWFHGETKIVGGTGDFEGARGYLTFDGLLVGAMGHGGYAGLLIRR